MIRLSKMALFAILENAWQRFGYFYALDGFFLSIRELPKQVFKKNIHIILLDILSN